MTSRRTRRGPGSRAGIGTSRARQTARIAPKRGIGRTHWRYAIGLALLTAIGARAAIAGGSEQSADDGPLPATYAAKIDEIPDYTQTDPHGELPGGGEQYCGPVAVSNSLMWLAGHGYPGLRQTPDAQWGDQAAMIRQLGSRTFMGTNPDTGTGPWYLLRGIKRFVSAQGYEYRRLQYQGWRWHEQEFATGVEVPQLSWVKRGVLQLGSTWLNVGWYQHDPDTSRYTRTGGHWLTLVGYGLDDGGHESGDVLIVHDSAAVAPEAVNLYLRTVPLAGGQLTGDHSRLPRSAEGYYELQGDLPLGADSVGILDGAVVLEM